jgi:hypothetical protein
MRDPIALILLGRIAANVGISSEEIAALAASDEETVVAPQRTLPSSPRASTLH